MTACKGAFVVDAMVMNRYYWIFYDEGGTEKRKVKGSEDVLLIPFIKFVGLRENSSTFIVDALLEAT